MKISYAITVYKELDEIIRLLDFLKSTKRVEDEIVVLFDDKGPDLVWNYLQTQEQFITLHPANFKNNFADWKNKHEQGHQSQVHQQHRVSRQGPPVKPH